MLLVALKLTMVVDGREVRRVDLLFDPRTGKRTGEVLEGGVGTPDNVEYLRRRGITVALLDQNFFVDSSSLKNILKVCEERRKKLADASS